MVTVAGACQRQRNSKEGTGEGQRMERGGVRSMCRESLGGGGKWWVGVHGGGWVWGWRGFSRWALSTEAGHRCVCMCEWNKWDDPLGSVTVQLIPLCITAIKKLEKRFHILKNVFQFAVWKESWAPFIDNTTLWMCEHTHTHTHTHTHIEFMCVSQQTSALRNSSVFGK